MAAGAELAGRVLGGCRASLARAVTLAESRAPRDAARAAGLMQALASGAPGRAGGAGFRVGLAGPPGAGKSTLVEALGLALVERGERTAVLAVDPSSERSGGSLLGDKTRMPKLGLHELAFVRPAPSAARVPELREKLVPVLVEITLALGEIFIDERVGAVLPTHVQDVTVVHF